MPRSTLRTTMPFSLSLAVLLLPACTPAPAPPEPEEEAEGQWLACVDDDLASVDPFGGPGYDVAKGGLLGTPQETYVAATTLFAHRNEPEALARFHELVDMVIAQAKTSPGFVGHELAFSEKCSYGRTITVWRDIDSMVAMVTSGAHATAMSEVRVVGYDGRTIDWDITPADLPLSWDTARARLAPTLP